MRKLLREPLLHFMLLAFALFVLHGWLAGDSSGTGENIVVTRGRVEQLAQSFEQLNQRRPDAQELHALVEDAIREEILVREAKTLGLDENDTIVRRRLRQKIEFISEDVAALPEPTDAQLQAYLAANAGKYRAETRYSLDQAYLDPQKHGAKLPDDAAQLLASLKRAGAARESSTAGDAFLLPRRYELVGAAELTRLFGADFELALRTMPIDTWSGPVVSGYGAHLVLLHRRDGGEAVGLNDVRDEVRRDWADAHRRQANERFYADLRRRYDVTVEQAVASKPNEQAAVAAEVAR